jgi:uncharacterized protein GlcG (DUF336 family)
MMFHILRSSKSLTLKAADAIANNAIQAVDKLAKYSPVCVTVLDSTGFVLVQKRMDGCPAGAYLQFSYTKAQTCINLETSTRHFRNKYLGSEAGPPQFTQAASMVSVMAKDLIPIAGGVLVKNAQDGTVVGAVGVSGASADEDEYLALEGIKAIRMDEMFITIPEDHSCKTLKWK